MASFEALTHTAQAQWASATVAPLPVSYHCKPTSIVLPPGKYFVGDPCYALTSYDKLWEAWLDKVQEQIGTAEEAVGGALVKNFPVIGARTFQGDGAFTSNQNFTFAVDSGLLGAIASELIGSEPQAWHALGLWRTFTSNTTVSVDRGVITIADVVVNTYPEQKI